MGLLVAARRLRVVTCFYGILTHPGLRAQIVVVWVVGCVFEARAYKRLEVSSMGGRIALSN